MKGQGQEEIEQKVWEINPIVHQQAATLATRSRSPFPTPSRHKTKRRHPLQQIQTSDISPFLKDERKEPYPGESLYSRLHQKCKNTLGYQEQIVRLKKQNLQLEQQLYRTNRLLHQVELKRDQCGGAQQIKCLEAQLQNLEKKIHSDRVYVELQKLEQRVKLLQQENMDLKQRCDENRGDRAGKAARDKEGKENNGDDKVISLKQQNKSLKLSLQHLHAKLRQDSELSRRQKSQIVALKEQKVRMLRQLKELEGQGRRPRLQLQSGRAQESEISELSEGPSERSLVQPNSVKQQLQLIRQLNKQLYSEINQLNC